MKNERGYALLVAVLSIVFIMLLGIGIVTVSSSSLKSTTVERSNQSLYYIAESGVNYYEAILYDAINQLYENEKQIAVANKVSQQDFDSSFNTKLSNLLNSYTVNTLNATEFLSTFNGTPIVLVKVHQSNGPRKFTISSEASLSGISDVKKVQRDYTIPDLLMTVSEVEELVTISTPNTNDGNLGNAPLPSTPTYKNAPIYVDDYLSMALVPKDHYSAKFFVDYKYNFFTSAFEIVPKSNRDNITYNISFPSNQTESVQYVDPPGYSSSIREEISLTNTTFTMTKDLLMKKLPNFSNKVFTINIPAGQTRTLLFKDNFLNYNLSSMRFNISGGGNLNIVFEKYFELNSGRKFIVNPSENSKVNLIFKNGSTIRGEMVAQDLYVKGRLEPTLSAKLIANNVYFSEGVFDKDFSSQVKIDDLYMKKGNLNISSPTNFFARNIVLKDGNVTLNTGSGLIANSLQVRDGDLRSHLTTCLHVSDTIYVPNGTTRVDDISNFQKLYTKKLFLIASSHINKGSCAKSQISINPEVQDTVQQFIKKKEYNFTSNNLIEKGILIEVK